MALEGGNASQSLLRNVCCTKEIAYNFHPLSRDIVISKKVRAISEKSPLAKGGSGRNARAY